MIYFENTWNKQGWGGKEGVNPPGNEEPVTCRLVDLVTEKWREGGTGRYRQWQEHAQQLNEDFKIHLFLQPAILIKIP